MKNNVLNILLCLEDIKWDYTRHCAVTILSLLETNKTHQIKIFIMSSDLSEENIKELKRIVKIYHQKIEFIISDKIIVDDIKEILLNRGDRRTLWAFYRLFFPRFIKNADRILYIDCDVLINGDLDEIYNIDMDSKSIVWYYDIPLCENLKKNYFKVGVYINSWVLLFDVNRYDFSKINIENIENINTEYWKHINNWDQDYLNIIFKDDIKIWEKWMNYQITSKFFNKWLKEASIIHCLSKPYVEYSNCPKWIIDLYYHYLSLTKRKDYPVDKVNYWYFIHIIRLIANFCYHWLVYLLGSELAWKTFGWMGKCFYKI